MQLSRCVAVYSRHFVASRIYAPVAVVAVVFTLDHIVTTQTTMGWTESLLYPIRVPADSYPTPLRQLTLNLLLTATIDSIFRYIWTNIIPFATGNKLSLRGRGVRGGSTSVRGRVRSPLTAKLQAASVPIAWGSCAMGQTDGQTDERIAVSLNAPLRRGA